MSKTVEPPTATRTTPNNSASQNKPKTSATERLIWENHSPSPKPGESGPGGEGLPHPRTLPGPGRRVRRNAAR